MLAALAAAGVNAADIGEVLPGSPARLEVVLGPAMLAPLLAAALALPRRRGGPPAFMVVVDPGHGGDQDGALSPAGVKEKDLMLADRPPAAAAAGALGARVVLTRTGDIGVPLTTRAAVANARQGRPLRLHPPQLDGHREARRTSSGVETYFLSADACDASAAAAAARENADRRGRRAAARPGDPVAAILDDLEHDRAAGRLLPPRLRAPRAAGRPRSAPRTAA